VDGAKWRHQRKVASHEFSTRVLRDYSNAVFRDTVGELARIMATATRGDEERLDISDLLMQSTLDSVDGVFWYTKHVHFTLVWI
jgi:cytochrome P450